jgi:hypothetical protein
MTRKINIHSENVAASFSLRWHRLKSSHHSLVFCITYANLSCHYNYAIDKKNLRTRAPRLSEPSAATGALASLGGTKGGLAMRILFPLRAA